MVQYILSGLPRSLENVARIFDATKRSELQPIMIKQAMEREMTRRSHDLEHDNNEAAYLTK